MKDARGQAAKGTSQRTAPIIGGRAPEDKKEAARPGREQGPSGPCCHQRNLAPAGTSQRRTWRGSTAPRRGSTAAEAPDAEKKVAESAEAPSAEKPAEEKAAEPAEEQAAAEAPAAEERAAEPAAAPAADGPSGASAQEEAEGGGEASIRCLADPATYRPLSELLAAHGGLAPPKANPLPCALR